jgi:hypothetical protein
MHQYGIDAGRIAFMASDRDLSFCRSRLVTGRGQHFQRNLRPVHDRYNGSLLPRLQAGRRALKPELSTGNDREMCRDLFDFGEQVTGEKNGDRAPPRQVADEPPHLVDARRIEAISRLVKNQQVGVTQQSDRNPEPLFHPSRIVPYQPVAHRQQIHHIERLVDSARRQSEQPCMHFEVFAPGQVQIRRWGLHHRPNPPQDVGAGLGKLTAEQRDRPPRRPLQSEKDTNRSRFSGPIRSEKSEDASRRHGERQSGERRGLAVRLPDVLQHNRLCGIRHYPSDTGETGKVPHYLRRCRRFPKSSGCSRPMGPVRGWTHLQYPWPASGSHARKIDTYRSGAIGPP